MRTPSFYSDPHVQFLSQLLDEINEGGLQVPRFQRPLVWDWRRRLELLRSIRDGIPIGAIMVWRTNTVEIECYDYLGPHLLKRPLSGSVRQYILDGVQRLSTLYGALHKGGLPSPMDVDEGDDGLPGGGTFDIYYDPIRDDFIDPEGEESIDRYSMPIHIVFDSVALLRYQRGVSGQQADEVIERTDQIARAFREYKIPIIPITTDDINLATRTFQRINSQGVSMSETHMVHALTWGPQFDLQQRISQLKAEVLAPIGWSELDDDPILKACKAAFDLDVYKTSAQELSDKLVAQPEELDQVVDSIARAGKFLWDRCGVRSPDLVPYSLQIVVLADAFRIAPDPSERALDLLHAWFWMTTYGEMFASMSGDRVQTALADMHRTVLHEDPYWTWRRPFEERPLRSTFDFRAARAKAYAFRLADSMDRVFGGDRGSKLLGEVGRKAVVQILPWSKSQREVFSSPGNRFLVHPSEASQLRDRLMYGFLTEEEMAAHFVSTEAQDLLWRGDYRGFVNKRVAEINKVEAAFVAPLVANFRPPQPRKDVTIDLDDLL